MPSGVEYGSVKAAIGSTMGRAGIEKCESFKMKEGVLFKIVVHSYIL